MRTENREEEIVKCHDGNQKEKQVQQLFEVNFVHLRPKRSNTA